MSQRINARDKARIKRKTILYAFDDALERQTRRIKARICASDKRLARAHAGRYDGPYLHIGSTPSHYGVVRDEVHLEYRKK